MEEGVVPDLCIHSPPRDKRQKLYYLEAEKCQVIDKRDKVQQVSGRERWLQLKDGRRLWKEATFQQKGGVGK